MWPRADYFNDSVASRRSLRGRNVELERPFEIAELYRCIYPISPFAVESNNGITAFHNAETHWNQKNCEIVYSLNLAFSVIKRVPCRYIFQHYNVKKPHDNKEWGLLLNFEVQHIKNRRFDLSIWSRARKEFSALLCFNNQPLHLFSLITFILICTIGHATREAEFSIENSFGSGTKIELNLNFNITRNNGVCFI